MVIPKQTYWLRLLKSQVGYKFIDMSGGKRKLRQQARARKLEAKSVVSRARGKDKNADRQERRSDKLYAKSNPIAFEVGKFIGTRMPELPLQSIIQEPILPMGLSRYRRKL